MTLLSYGLRVIAESALKEQAWKAWTQILRLMEDEDNEVP